MEDLDFGFNEVSDSRLAGYLKRYCVRKHVGNESISGLVKCGSRIIPTGREPAVFLVTSGSGNEAQSMYTGLARCHSPWACPHCTPRVMAQKGTDIACAIDALSTWHNQSAMMITFTLPHSFNMSAADTFKILKDTWREFTRRGNGRGEKKYVLKTTAGTDKRSRKDENAKAGDVVTYRLNIYDAYASFRRDLGIRHYVKVYEFTYGENGWHPHIHALFWCPNENWKKINDYADRLLNSWWEAAKKCALMHWNKIRPDSKEENKKAVEEYYTDWRKAPKDGHRSVYISVDSKGQPLKQKSSSYISGWSADSELTSLDVKTSKQSGHYTPFQLVEMSMKNAAVEDKWMGIFLDYAIATRASRRVEFSHHSGIGKIVRKWKQTEKYAEFLKKKVMDKAKNPWKVVCWFTSEQWSRICYLDLFLDHEVQWTLLKMARAPDAFDKIYSFLKLFEIDIMNGKHPLEESVANNLFTFKDDVVVDSEISA